MFLSHFMTVNAFGGEYVALASESGKSINFFEAFQSVIKNTEYYKKTDFLSLFSHPFAGGLLGYVLIALFNSLFGIANGGFIIAIVFAVLAVIFYFLPLILSLIGQSKAPVKKEEKETVSRRGKEQLTGDPVQIPAAEEEPSQPEDGR